MANFYTNVQSLGGKILYRGVKDGKRIKLKIDYEPQLYLPARKGNGTHKSLDGIDLVPKRFDGIREARDYVKQFEDVAGGTKIYGTPDSNMHLSQNNILKWLIGMLIKFPLA